MKISTNAVREHATVCDFSPYDSLGYGGTGLRAIQDSALRQSGVYNMVDNLTDYQQFLGYGVLSALSQNGIIRAGVNLRADEMTRRWVEYNYTGESMSDDEAAAEIEAEKALNLKACHFSAFSVKLRKCADTMAGAWPTSTQGIFQARICACLWERMQTHSEQGR